MALAPGDLVAVPLGQRAIIGVVWGARRRGEVAAGKLKPVDRRLDAPPLPEITRRFIDWVARYTAGAAGRGAAHGHERADGARAAADDRSLAAGARSAGAMPAPASATSDRRAPARAARCCSRDRRGRTADLARAAGVGTGVVKAMAAAGAARDPSACRRCPPSPARPDPDRRPGPRPAPERRGRAR